MVLLQPCLTGAAPRGTIVPWGALPAAVQALFPAVSALTAAGLGCVFPKPQGLRAQVEQGWNVQAWLEQPWRDPVLSHAAARTSQTQAALCETCSS